jgi:tetratricopeptide (TPR) repeat protein
MGKNKKNRQNRIYVDYDENDENDGNDGNTQIIENNMNNMNNDKYFAEAYHAEDYENDYEKAIKLYKESMNNDDQSYHGISAYNIGLIYDEQLNDNENAEKYYKIACGYNYKNAFLNLGLLYYIKKNYTEAEKYFEKAVQFGICSIFQEYAITLEKVNKKEEAFKYLKYHLLLKNSSTSEKKMFCRLINCNIDLD